MTLIVGIATADGIVVSADSRITIQETDLNGQTFQRAGTGEKIWLQAGRLAIASCGAASIDVPKAIGAFHPTGATLGIQAHGLIAHLSGGVVPDKEWVVLLGGIESGVPTLLRLDVLRGVVIVLSSARQPTDFRAWAEGCLPRSPMPVDTERWTLERARDWSMAAIGESATLYPDLVGLPASAITITASGLGWSSAQ